MFKTLFKYLWIGILAIIPLFIIIQIILWAIKFGYYLLISTAEYLDGGYTVLAILIVLGVTALMIIGYVVEKNGKFFMITLLERLVDKIPFIKTIYRFLQDSINLIFKRDGSSFKDVVMVDFPNSNAKSLGFITAKVSNDYYVIFIPTAPNPTNGFVVIMHKKDVDILDISIDDALKTIVSMGVVVSDSAKSGIIQYIK